MEFYFYAAYSLHREREEPVCVYIIELQSTAWPSMAAVGADLLS